MACSTAAYQLHRADPTSPMGGQESPTAEPEEMFYGIFEAMPAAIVILDGRGWVTHINPHAELLLGAGLVGTLWREQICQLFDMHRRDNTLQLLNGRRVSLTTQSLGQRGGQLIMLQDVTEVERLQQRLNQNQRLEALGTMAANLAHQIRTPLATALLYTTQLDHPDLDPLRRHRFVTKSVQALRGLDQLVTQMLLFVRGERGEMVNFSVSSLMHELIAEIKGQTQTLGVNWSVDDACGGIEIYSSRTLFKSAMSNLLMNAAEAQGGVGGGTITLRLHGVEQGLKISVEDQAGGISDTLQQRLFQVYPSHKSGGTGLGLALVKRIVDGLGGSVALSSTSEKGSHFQVLMPLSVSKSADMAYTAYTARG